MCPKKFPSRSPENREIGLNATAIRHESVAAGEPARPVTVTRDRDRRRADGLNLKLTRKLGLRRTVTAAKH
jgi:hypothetical protein